MVIEYWYRVFMFFLVCCCASSFIRFFTPSVSVSPLVQSSWAFSMLFRLELQPENAKQRSQNMSSHPQSQTWNPRMPTRCFQLILTQNSWWQMVEVNAVSIFKTWCIKIWLDSYSSRCVIMSCYCSNTNLICNLYSPIQFVGPVGYRMAIPSILYKSLKNGQKFALWDKHHFFCY